MKRLTALILSLLLLLCCAAEEQIPLPEKLTGYLDLCESAGITFAQTEPYRASKSDTLYKARIKGDDFAVTYAEVRGSTQLVIYAPEAWRPLMSITALTYIAGLSLEDAVSLYCAMHLHGSAELGRVHADIDTYLDDSPFTLTIAAD